MKKILVYGRTIIELIVLPMRVIYFFCIKPIFIYLVRKEIKYERDRYKNLLETYKEKCKEYDDNCGKTERLTKKINRLESVFEYHKNLNIEVSYTKKQELVFIFFSNLQEFNVFYLCGINGSHQSNDCRISLSNGLGYLKINDIISNTTNRGYARTLLEFTIKMAKEFGVKRILGDLSSVDSEKFDWLIPFYESIGFKTRLFDDRTSKMDGEIEMTL